MKNFFREYAPRAFNMSKNRAVVKTPAKNISIEYLLPAKLLEAVATHVTQKIHTKGLKMFIINPLLMYMYHLGSSLNFSFICSILWLLFSLMWIILCGDKVKV